MCIHRLSLPPNRNHLNHPETPVVEAALAIAVDEVASRQKLPARDQITRVTGFSGAQRQSNAIATAGPASFARGFPSWRQLQKMNVAVELR